MIELLKNMIDIFFSNSKLLFYIIIIFILCILIDKIYPKFRGFMGEFWVKIELGKLPKNKYIIFSDILIKDEKGTHQIDHLVLSKFGIFVIEMKNYYGLIKGKEFDNKWCQYLGKNKSYFTNPIYQNFGHIKSLSNLFKIEEKYFISVICFSNQAKIKVKSNNIVTQVDYLNKNILRYSEEISDIDIEKLSNIVINNNIKDRKSRRQHIKDIHLKIKKDKKLEDNMICPKCGNQLIKRNGRYGQFIGCSNYPKCRYIKK